MSKVTDVLLMIVNVILFVFGTLVAGAAILALIMVIKHRISSESVMGILNVGFSGVAMMGVTMCYFGVISSKKAKTSRVERYKNS